LLYRTSTLPYGLDNDDPERATTIASREFSKLWHNVYINEKFDYVKLDDAKLDAGASTTGQRNAGLASLKGTSDETLETFTTMGSRRHPRCSTRAVIFDRGPVKTFLPPLGFTPRQPFG